MKYAVVFEQGPTSVGAMVPDLPGCFAVAPNMTEARTMVADAIEFHIRCLKRRWKIPFLNRLTMRENIDVAA